MSGLITLLNLPIIVLNMIKKILTKHMLVENVGECSNKINTKHHDAIVDCANVNF